MSRDSANAIAAHWQGQERRAQHPVTALIKANLRALALAVTELLARFRHYSEVISELPMSSKSAKSNFSAAASLSS